MAGKEQGVGFGREAGGLGFEVVGAIAVGIGFLSLELAPAVAGGVLLLIGRWVRNYGKQGQAGK